MSNDIDAYSDNDIQPYNPGMPVLAPLSPSPDTWGTLTNREIDEYQRQPQSQGPMLWGAALPAGTTPQQINAVLGEISGVYLSDFTKLGYPSALIHSSIQFFTDNATKAPQQVQRRHSFTLPKDLSNDWLAILFANHLQGLAGTQAQKQQFLNASLQWLDKLNARLNAQQTGTSQEPRTAPASTEAVLNSLSDADYAKVVAINNKAQAETMQKLAAKYGQYSVQQVVEIAQNHLNSLPANERAYFDQLSTGGVALMNCVETLEFLYNAAIGANSIPKDGAGIAHEIASFEAMLKIPSERQKYMRDPAMQARLRELYMRRG
ncbi:hypothetical protein [Pseudomonas izuensis]|uniref:hypothetical protein n=1 Tax=Pseudomonas izuensis TaxID=2684212 RepID=UPI00135B29BC|nr:hypothetical protein [Pseudomonas izuensis]